MHNQSSAILHESERVVVIATNLKRKSKNSKTGNAVQVWIIPRFINPVEAYKTGDNRLVCGGCPIVSSCYVNLARAPLNIWHAYTNGHYRYLPVSEYSTAFAGHIVRLGAYGDPVLIPLPIMKALSEASSHMLGYTHQWRHPWFSAYKRYLMASCEPDNYQQAITAGWRAFVVSSKKIEGLMTCPASAEFEHTRGYRLTCEKCGQCA